jgi:hypothetical protein
LVFVVGCAVDSAPTATITVKTVGADDLTTGSPEAREPDRDVCALAGQLSSDDICSQICDPDAMEARLVAQGRAPGACYQFLCNLPDTSHVTVGVCLPPPTEIGVRGDLQSATIAR